MNAPALIVIYHCECCGSIRRCDEHDEQPQCCNKKMHPAVRQLCRHGEMHPPPHGALIRRGLDAIMVQARN